MKKLLLLPLGVLSAFGELAAPQDFGRLAADVARSEAFARMSVDEFAAVEARAVREMLDLALLPPVVNTRPDARHLRDQLDFAMNGSLTWTPGGRLFAIWAGGEDDVKCFTVGTWSDDGGKTWHDTRFTVGDDRPIFRLGRAPVYRTAISGDIWSAPDGTLRLYVHQAINMFDSRGALFEIVCRNPDAAEPVWESARLIGWGGVPSHPIVLGDGTWLLPNSITDAGHPFYPELDAVRGCGALASSDLGRTWTPRGFVRPSGCGGYMEHSLVDLDGGAVRMYFRTDKGLRISDSSDAGRSWSEPRADDHIRQAVSRSQVIRLRDGRLVLVKNGDRIDKVIPHPNGGSRGSRNELTAYLSDDRGRTWKGGLVLDERTDVAYPDVVEGSDGFVYVSYDHGRNSLTDEILFAKVRVEDILERKIVRPGSSLKNVIFRETAHRRHRRTYADF